MRHLRGLDGLFGLDIDDSHLAITAAGLEPLISLAHLAVLGGWSGTTTATRSTGPRSTAPLKRTRSRGPHPVPGLSECTGPRFWNCSLGPQSNLPNAENRGVWRQALADLGAFVETG